jgi:hypothetical protein
MNRNSDRHQIVGAGLGLRREMLDSFDELSNSNVNFLEVAPENWLPVGGAMGRKFKKFTEQFPVVLHGLSLSIGSTDQLDEALVQSVKKFMDEFNIDIYSEHLSYCSDRGHLYDLMPIPFTAEAVKHVVARIKRVQDIIERPLVIENASYYATITDELSEIDFTNAIIEESGCEMLLDVNNVYVNSINHGYDAKQFINAMPTEKIRYIHIAGHFDEADDLLVDTHGDDVKSQVWSLLRYCYQQHGIRPTLLERDFNIPPLPELFKEVDKIVEIQQLIANNQTINLNQPQLAVSNSHR